MSASAPEGGAGATVLPGAAIVGLEAEDAPTALRALSARLLGIGAVTDSFEAAVLQREEMHPTGLPTLVPAAIPHTDPEHVITPGFAIAVPKEPVVFGEIGSSGERTIWAELIVMLVLADAHSQLAALQNLVARLQEPQAVRDMLAATDDADLERRARDWLAG
ncbi:PTS fructose transporter subunit IIA [Brachybacterium ginsengisoli]|uniref:PTS fructose transporter subunit IIA n=1 Tax=Brachybacterium ginsengisoli TaxID=1331682 RepID=A0A291H0R0_9MICO|nr:PTS sugar transporter subunit IIA [Brachybacterium ginsengisoli]ATG55982.1 PTS fructose transporter subunit IIA [Brachybacterium ginsengisoli]